MRHAFRCSLWVILVCASSGWAQETIDGYEYLPESRWGQLGRDAAGKKFYLEGRWDGIRLEDVSLYMAPTDGFLFVKAGSPVQGRLASNMDSRRERMDKRRSTVRVFATAELQGNRSVLWVNKVYKLEDDAAKFAAELASLSEDATPAAIQELAERIRALARRYKDERLEEVAQRALQRELHARRSLLKPEDYTGGIALAERMLEVGDQDGAIQVLSDFEARADGSWRSKLRQRLRDLGAVNSGGEWLPFTEFKRREGFIRRPDATGQLAWVQREWAEFEQVMDDERKLQETMVVPARKNELRHYHDAQSGRIVRGQTMAEVRLAVGGEFPALVHHLRALAPGPAAARSALWSQWVLEDGRRVYFLDQGGGGEVITFKAAQVAWPR